MKGEVISLHDGFHLDVSKGESIPPKAIVQFESGITLMVDERMRWERVESDWGFELVRAAFQLSSIDLIGSIQLKTPVGFRPDGTGNQAGH